MRGPPGEANASAAERRATRGAVTNRTPMHPHM